MSLNDYAPIVLFDRKVALQDPARRVGVFKNIVLLKKIFSANRFL